MTATAERSGMRRFLKGTGIVVLLVLGFIAYARYAESAAERKAQAFCDTVAVGAPETGIVERAIAVGAHRRQTRRIETNGEVWIPATFTGLTDFSRYICSIQVKNGVVASRELGYLD